MQPNPCCLILKSTFRGSVASLVYVRIPSTVGARRRGMGMWGTPQSYPSYPYPGCPVLSRPERHPSVGHLVQATHLGVDEAAAGEWPMEQLS